MEAISTAAIDKVLGLAPARILDVDGYKYIDKNNTATLFQPPAPKAIDLSTVEGLVQLMEVGFESFNVADTLLHVKAFDEVALLSKHSDGYGKRRAYVESKALKPETAFRFGIYHTQEDFNIALASLFVQDANTADLLAVSGNLAQKAEVRQKDDGFTQTTTAKAGVVMVKEITVKPRVTLRPFRTFLEVEQPAGDFIFRVKHDETRGNTCALFEADGGQWKLQAMGNVRQWLKNRLKGSEVTGLSDIPVIA